ncbi:MAG TPA: SRPBCC family protein [Actinomycetota bacterium]|nr:SRPBCC family protein [Actinomycetota bacterium]
MDARTRGGRANALPAELTARASAGCRAPAAAVYELLADPRTHLIWGGERQKRSSRLLSVEAPEGQARVGTEFRTEGTDPMGGFTDVSVVTEADRPRRFEFVTEARLTTKRGRAVDWTIVHRYELVPEPSGACRIDYTARITRISELPGMLAVLRVPVLSTVARKASEGAARRGVRNLARLAGERAGR